MKIAGVRIARDPQTDRYPGMDSTGLNFTEASEVSTTVMTVQSRPERQPQLPRLPGQATSAQPII